MSAEKSEKHEKNDLKRDFLILSASFTFTILVGGFIIFNTPTVKVQSEEEIEKLIQKIVQAKFESIPKFNNYYDRKSDQLYDDERARSKRAVHEFRIASTGEFNYLDDDHNVCHIL
jgi:hypothetical protein